MNNDLIIEHVVGESMGTILALNPQIKEMIERHQPRTYEQFVNRIYTDLENVISITEAGKQHHQAKGEDELTDHLLSQLGHLYPSALHDAQKGGHCDLHLQVKSQDGTLFTWIGEAKLWKGYQYGKKGLFNQLLDSYASGGNNVNSGGMIFYERTQQGPSYVMSQWKEGLQNDNVVINDIRSDNLRFSTTHNLNEGNGPIFNVRHFVVGLYHQPTQTNLKKIN